MKSRDEFMLPYLQRTCPEGVPAEVWRAFAEYADHKGSRQEREQKWLAYLEIKKKYYDQDGKRLNDPKTVIQPAKSTVGQHGQIQLF